MTNPAPYTVTRTLVARVAHESWRAAMRHRLEPEGPDWDGLEDQQRSDAVALVSMLAADDADRTPEEIHTWWIAEMTAQGWTEGPKFDAEKRHNPLMVPYAGLAPSQRLRESIFRAVVSAFRSGRKG